MYYVYFIKSKKTHEIYVGSTNRSPFERTTEHNNSSNQWAKGRKPFELLYYEEYACISDVRKREQFYKTGFGKEIKRKIVAYLKEKGIKPKQK